MFRRLVVPALVLAVFSAAHASGLEFPTIDPSSTACPYYPTTCPNLLTTCSTVPTQCPQSTTQCPEMLTACPGSITICPALESICSSSQTVCPPIGTECPKTLTECPVWSCGPVPSVINHQGRLLGSTNRPVTGVKVMRFEFYNAADGGERVNDFSEEQSVAVTDGIFNVLVGSATVGGVPSNTFNPTDVFLSVKVEGDELLPRRRVAAVPYALRASESDQAGNATKLEGLTAASFANASHGHDDRYYSRAQVDALIAVLQAQINALSVR